jgi:hypothetical protein
MAKKGKLVGQLVKLPTVTDPAPELSAPVMVCCGTKFW